MSKYLGNLRYSEYLSLNNADPKNSDKRGSSVYFEYLMILCLQVEIKLGVP